MSVRIWFCAMLMVLGAACVPAASHTNKIPQFDPTKTKMGEIQQRGSIKIGIPSDSFPFGYVSRSGKATGFTAALGGMVARALDVSPHVLPRRQNQLLAMLDSGQADLVFPMIPITQTAVATHPFSDPYYLAHQRLLVPSGSGIRQVADLGRKRVCSAIDPVTEIALTRLDPEVRLLRVNSVSDCLRSLKSGRAAAATGPDVALLSLRAKLPGSQLVGDRLSTEGYGAAVSPCDPGLAQFVTRVFASAKGDGDWTTLYRRWVLPATGSRYVPDPPTLTVIDAWDLFPSPPGSSTPSPVACPTK